MKSKKHEGDHMSKNLISKFDKFYGIQASLNKVVLVFMMILFTLYLVSCSHNQPEIIGNPYFEDTSKNDYEDVLNLKMNYDALITDYYNDTYAMDIGNWPFLLHRIPGFELLPDTEFITKTDLSTNHDLIDQRDVYQYSAFYPFIAGVKWFFVFFDTEGCQENTLCQDDKTSDYMHYAMHDSEIYITYSNRTSYGREVFTYYYVLNEDDTLYVEFSLITYDDEDEITDMSYVEYKEDDYELNMIYESVMYDYDYYEITHNNIQSSEVISTHFYSPGAYRYHYYDPVKDISYVFSTDGITAGKNSFLTQYEENQIKLNCDMDLSRISINLYFVNGWTKLKVDELYIHPTTATLYQNELLIDENLIVTYDSVLGSVEWNSFVNSYNERVEEDLITLSRFGLNSGYTYESIDTMFEDGFRDSIDAINRYDLKMSYSEAIDLFESTFNTTLN